MPPDIDHHTRIALLERQQELDREADRERWARSDKTLEGITENLKLLAKIEAQNIATAEEVKMLRVEVRELRDVHSTRLDGVEDDLSAVKSDIQPLKEARSGLVKGVSYILLAVLAAGLAAIGIKAPH